MLSNYIPWEVGWAPRARDCGTGGSRVQLCRLLPLRSQIPPAAQRICGSAAYQGVEQARSGAIARTMLPGRLRVVFVGRDYSIKAEVPKPRGAQAKSHDVPFRVATKPNAHVLNREGVLEGWGELLLSTVSFSQQ